MHESVAELVALVGDAPTANLEPVGEDAANFHGGEAEAGFAGGEAAAFNHGEVGFEEGLRFGACQRNAELLCEKHDVGAAGLRVDADDGAGADFSRVAPKICTGIFAFAAAVHSSPGAEGSGADDRCAVGNLQTKSRVGGVGEAGEAGE